MKTVMAMTKSDVDGSSAHNVSSDAQEGSGGDMALRPFPPSGEATSARMPKA